MDLVINSYKMGYNLYQYSIDPYIPDDGFSDSPHMREAGLEIHSPSLPHTAVIELSFNNFSSQ